MHMTWNHSCIHHIHIHTNTITCACWIRMHGRGVLISVYAYVEETSGINVFMCLFVFSCIFAHKLCIYAYTRVWNMCITLFHFDSAIHIFWDIYSCVGLHTHTCMPRHLLTQLKSVFCIWEDVFLFNWLCCILHMCHTCCGCAVLVQIDTYFHANDVLHASRH
jgi:hypothetical protein